MPCEMGSSPLTRGKLRLDTLQRRTGGAHPRSRGENNEEGSTPTVGQGSSPLTRGKPDVLVVLKIATGLIPAHAGKTGTGYLLVRNDGAHPRSRGENVTLSRSRSILTGSSPLTRGK